MPGPRTEPTHPDRTGPITRPERILPVLRRIPRVIDGVSKWSGLVVAPLVLVYLVILLYEMIARYVFNAPTLWAHEMSTFVFGAQFMLGGAYCYWSGSMVNVELFHARFSKRARAVFDLFIFLSNAWREHRRDSDGAISHSRHALRQREITDQD